MKNILRLFAATLISLVPSVAHSVENSKNDNFTNLIPDNDNCLLHKKRENLSETVPIDNTTQIIKNSNKVEQNFFDLDSIVFTSIDKWDDSKIQSEISRLSKLVQVSEKDSKTNLSINDFII